MEEHRRPLATRAQRWPRAIAALLGKVGITANGISVFSILFGFSTFYILVFEPHESFFYNCLWAALCVQLRLLCNLLDGLVAVEGGKQTPTGGLYNEVPDRLSDALTLIGVGYACRAYPLGVELGYLATVLAFFTAYIRVLGASLGTTSYFLGPMAKQHRMAAITVALVLTAFIRFKLMLWVGLWIVTLGAAITCYRRLRYISADLHTNAD